ncbi:mitotic-spindle organizing protein 1 [Scaptodrosophila lebanonensis]|uniref:Mitotic-spindle organizing protein 1 n=1 Tax=Drosophila lebanonensis TaxID=7225 RepID=A0A6J2UFY4_DROLE|nr:mitotic-spindle organizing protein 1 [Scaptodrosophila lebanonensis]
MSDEKASIDNSQTVRKLVHAMSDVINTGLSYEALDVCMDLLDAGVSPMALANIVRIMSVEVKVQTELNNDSQV